MSSMPDNRRSFFRHLRDGKSLRENPLTWLAIGEAAGVLPELLLVRELHDRLSHLVDGICAGPMLASKTERARRIRAIFARHILGGEHWSSIAAELFVSRRQFFRERRFLCDELSAVLQLGPLPAASNVIVQPSREQFVLNEAYLAVEAGNLESADRIAGELCASLPAGDTRFRALLLAADCAMRRLRFDDAAVRFERASAEANLLTGFDDRAIGSARVNLTRSLYYFLLSDYDRANSGLASARRALSHLEASRDARRSELLRAILVAQAELALHVGDLGSAVEHVRHCKYATGSNDAGSEVTFDLASIEAATESFAGRFESALMLLEKAYASAQRLGFNHQVLRMAIERAWVTTMANPGEGLQLARTIAGMAETLHVPYLSLEAALFCAANEQPAAAMDYATKARACAPARSIALPRAIQAQANASFRLGRVADAFDLAVEAENLSERAGNNRMRACSLAFMARVKLKTGDRKAALILKNNADELLRLYAGAGQRNVYANSAQSP
jgi:hypothetical protein